VTNLWHRFNKQALLFSIMLALVLPMIQLYQRLQSHLGQKNIFLDSPFTLWMGVDGFNFAAVTYYLVIPLLAALPAATLLKKDAENGYLMQLRLKGVLAKVVATYYAWSFILGGLIVALPLLLNISLFALFYPSIVPDNLLNQNILVIHANTFGVGLYYQHPWVHSLLNISLVFLWGGLFATFITAMSLHLKNRFLALSTGLLLQLGLLLIQVLHFFSGSFAPMDFLKQSATSNTSFMGMIILTLVMIGLIGILTRIGARKLADL